MVNLACLTDICADQSIIPFLGISETLVDGEKIRGPTVCHQRQLQRREIFIQQNTLCGSAHFSDETVTVVTENVRNLQWSAT